MSDQLSGADGGYTTDEMMSVAAARELKDGAVCFVGIGLPSEAANLARATHAPNCVLIYASGTIGAKPETLPLSIGDGVLAEHADSVVWVPEIFNNWLQAGRVDVGFLGGAQIDRYGNINTTVIGSYDDPKVGLPGAGGAPEIAASAKEVMMVLRQRSRSFVERLDYVTLVGHRHGGDSRAELGYPGAGPTTVITDLGVLRPDPETKELTLVALHPGATAEGAREATGWELRVSEKVATTEPPTDEELEVLRELHAKTAAARAETS